MQPEVVISKIEERTDVTVDAIVNPYIVTISGRSVAFTKPTVEWRELTSLLQKAADIVCSDRRGFMCVENKPGAEVGDYVGLYDLRKCHCDFILMPIKDLIHGSNYPGGRGLPLPINEESV